MRSDRIDVAAAESTGVATEPLPWDVLAEIIAADYLARLIPEMQRATTGLVGGERDLTTIHVLNAIANEARRLTTLRARNAVYAGTSQTAIAKALGISRQAVNQNYKR